MSCRLRRRGGRLLDLLTDRLADPGELARRDAGQHPVHHRPKVQVQALEDGIEPEVVTARITELRADKQAAEDALAELDPQEAETEDAFLQERLGRIPDLGQSLRDATPEIKRQTFDAFGLRIEFDKAQRRIEISATIAEAVADAFENTKALQTEGFQVTVNEIAGAGFEPATFGL